MSCNLERACIAMLVRPDDCHFCIACPLVRGAHNSEAWEVEIRVPIQSWLDRRVGFTPLSCTFTVNTIRRQKSAQSPTCTSQYAQCILSILKRCTRHNRKSIFVGKSFQDGTRIRKQPTDVHGFQQSLESSVAVDCMQASLYKREKQQGAAPKNGEHKTREGRREKGGVCSIFV